MKTMIEKLKMLLPVFILSGALWLNANAQAPQGGGNGNGGNGGNKGDRIESLKVAFISEQLNLTPEEAQKFWPIYNSYKADLKTLRDNFFPTFETKLTADQQLDWEQKKLDLKKKYKSQFEAALGKDKANTLYGLEQKFKEKLKEFRDQRQQRGGGPGGNRGGGWGR